MPLEDKINTFSLLRWVGTVSGAILSCFASGSSAGPGALRLTMGAVENLGAGTRCRAAAPVNLRWAVS